MEILKVQKFSVQFSKFYHLKNANTAVKRTYGKKPQQPEPPKKAAIILSGCGHLDGSSIYETVAAAVTLSKCNIIPEFFAPKVLQCSIVNHNTGCPEKTPRCALIESARLARGPVTDISELRYCDYSCLVVPGGMGVTKILTTFEEDKESCSINADLMRVMEEFHDAKKPMTFISIAAIIPARMFPLVKVTFGKKGKKELWPHQYLIEIACQMGAELEQNDVDGFTFDKQHMVFTTPAYLYNGTSGQVFDGVSHTIYNMAKYAE